jgi:hypothetical protein
MQLLILWFSPAFCCFLHFRSRVLLDVPLYVRRLLEAVNVLIALQAISERQSPPKICMGSALCLDQIWGPPSLLSNGVLSLGVNSCQGVTLTTHPIYFRGQETAGAYLLSSLAPVWCVRDRFTLRFTCYGDHMVLMVFFGPCVIVFMNVCVLIGVTGFSVLWKKRSNPCDDNAVKGGLLCYAWICLYTQQNFVLIYVF